MTSSPALPDPQKAARPALRLLCHPATPCEHPLALSCSVWTAATTGAALHLRYELKGKLAALRLPEPAPDGAADGLWQHTCFEAFVMQTGARAYQEFNFSPSGQWASYRFRAERVRDLRAEVAQQLGPHTQRPQLRVERGADRLVVHATLAHEAIAAPTPGGLLRLGLSAVVEDSTGQLSYWALHHPGDRPDFHHPDGFVHQVPWPPVP